MSDRETVDFLATVPLLEGRERGRPGGAGAGDAPADGARRARSSGARATTRGSWCSSSTAPSRRRCSVPGDRTVEIGSGRSRGDGRRDRAARRRRAHDERARDRDARRCSRSAGWSSRRCSPASDPSAFRLKRRLASLFTARLRSQLRHLAASLGGEPAGPAADECRAAVRRARGLPAARQQVRAPHGDASTTSIRWRSGAS